LQKDLKKRNFFLVD